MFLQVFSASRGFSAEEEAHFAALAQQSYDSFVHKAAASRSMSVQAMEEVRILLTVCGIARESIAT